MRNPFRRAADTGGYPKTDAGSGSLDQYAYDLRPSKESVVMQLAGSDPFQAELAGLVGMDELQAVVSPRTLEEERTDAPLPVRLFAASRVTGIVGYAPRGLEQVLLETVVRLKDAGRSTRIPAQVTTTRSGHRVTLLVGKTR